MHMQAEIPKNNILRWMYETLHKILIWKDRNQHMKTTYFSIQLFYSMINFTPILFHHLFFFHLCFFFVLIIVSISVCTPHKLQLYTKQFRNYQAGDKTTTKGTGWTPSPPIYHCKNWKEFHQHYHNDSRNMVFTLCMKDLSRENKATEQQPAAVEEDTHIRAPINTLIIWRQSQGRCC